MALQRSPVLRLIVHRMLLLICVLISFLRAKSSRSTPSVITPIPLPSSTIEGGIVLLQPPFAIPQHKIIRLDLYGELLCPDYRDFESVESQILEKYKYTNLLVVLHLFPLPYHHVSYAINQAALGLALNSLDPGKTLRTFRNAVFDTQETFGNYALINKTMTEITQQVGEIAESAGLPREVAMDSMWERDMDLRLRVALKAAWARGVTGTPSLYLNSVPLFLTGDDEWTVDVLSEVIDSCSIFSVLDGRPIQEDEERRVMKNPMDMRGLSWR